MSKLSTWSPWELRCAVALAVGLATTAACVAQTSGPGGSGDSGVADSVGSRDTGLEVCADGQVSAPCQCGATPMNQGFCCGGVPHSGECPFVEAREAESGTSLGQMAVMQGILVDPACGDNWVEVSEGPADFVWDQGAPVLPAHRTELAIDLPHAGTYYVWVRMASLADTKDALHVGFDVADLRRIFPPDDYLYDGTWTWVSAVPGAADRLVFSALAAGPHTLIVAHGEAGARVDKVVVANDAAATFDRSCGPRHECSSGATDPRACAITNGTGQETRVCLDGTWGEFGTCTVTGCDTHHHIEGNACVEDTVPDQDYPFRGYTDTRGAFEALVDGAADPRILVVDSLSGSSSVGNETTGRGSLPWALTRNYPRVILFEISGVIDTNGTVAITSPYVSVHGQTAPSPGITLYDVDLLVRTHDVIIQHLRVRMGEIERGGGDAMGVCAAAGDVTHDIIIDHCSAGLGHDEQLSISACGAGHVRRVTLSNNLIAFGLNYAGHAFGTLIDSGGSNAYDVDEISVDGNLFANVTYRTPLVNHAVRHITITNNVTYNAQYTGMAVNSAQYPEGQYIDALNNLNWRGPASKQDNQFPREEAATWPAQPDLWPWNSNVGYQWVVGFNGASGDNTHVYFESNYDYVNNWSYSQGNHEGRPIEIEDQQFAYVGDITPQDVIETSRQTSLQIPLMTPVQLEGHVQLDVGCTPYDRDDLDALAVSNAIEREGGYINYVADLAVDPVPTGGQTRSLTSIAGYPASPPLANSDGDRLTDLEEWIYGL